MKFSLLWLCTRWWWVLFWGLFFCVMTWKNAAPSKKQWNKRYPWETKAQWEERIAYTDQELERRRQAEKSKLDQNK